MDVWHAALAAEKQLFAQVSSDVHWQASRHVAYVAHGPVTAARSDAQFVAPHVSHATLSGPCPFWHVSAASLGLELELLHAEAASATSAAETSERTERDRE
jgi:hypothetical protein